MKTGGRPSRSQFPAARTTADGLKWVQVTKAARSLGVTKGRIYQLIRARRLRSRGLDGISYVRTDDVDVYRIYQREVKNVQRLGRARLAS